MKNFILIFSLFVFFVFGAESKAQPYYYNSGIPTLFSSWGNQPGGTGTNPSSFGENTEYIIESGKTITLDFQWFIDNNATLRVNKNATLQINHTLNIGPAAMLRLDSNATCIYNSTALARNTIFNGTEYFHRYSFFKVTNWSSVNNPLTDSVKGVKDSSNVLESFHHFGNLEIDWQGCNGNWYIIGNHFLYHLCGNDFRLTNTGAGKIVTCQYNTSNQSSIYMQNFIQTGGELDMSYSSTSTFLASILRINQNFTKTGGILDASDDNAIGEISLENGFSSPEFLSDTAFRTFYNSGTMRNLRIELDRVRLRLLSDMNFPIPNDLCIFLAGATLIEFGDYKISGDVPSIIADCTFKIRSPQGFKNGSSGGNFVLSGIKNFTYGNTIEFCGSTAQIMGDSIPQFSPYINYKINNTAGVTLNRDIRIGTDNSIKFAAGKLNLGNFNLKMVTSDSLLGVNENRFINTNGTGVLRLEISGYVAKYPIGNGTFSPFYITQAYTGNNDTIGVRVENNYGAYAPFDTSRAVRKLWRVFDENTLNSTSFRVAVQFMKSDAGSNMNYSEAGAIGQYITGYNGYRAITGYYSDGFYPSPDSTISKAINSYVYTTTGDDYFVAGNEDGVFETYYPVNSVDAGTTNGWASINGGIHPQSFDRYAIFKVANGQTAAFNTPAVFTDKAFLRMTGNGVINANSSVTVNGWIQFRDSSTYNHNNSSVLSQTLYAGREEFSKNMNFNILMWSDTTDKIYDELEAYYGNLTINFNNLPNPIGTNNYWTVFKNVSPYYNYAIINGNLKYLQSSDYKFSPLGYGNNTTTFTVKGNVQIGDSLNNTAFPSLSLSGGTTLPQNSNAGTLNICGNLDIQIGSITSQDFPVTARGRINFTRDDNTIPKSHTFYCYNPFNWQTYGLGTTTFPNTIEYDTLTLKSDMYRSGNPAFLFTDAWEVKAGAALNMDTYRIRSLNLKIKNGGKLITKNPDGFYADLTNQTVTFESNSSLEFAGSTPQSLEKTGAYYLASLPNLIINNPSNVTVNIPDVSITGSITFIAGKLISDNTNYLTVNESVQYNGASGNSFFSGPLKLNTTSMNTVTIPLGKGSNLRNIVITPTNSNSTDWTVEYFNQQQAYGNTLGAGLTSISNNEYFLINRSGASPANAFLGLSWGANSGVTNPENLRIARWDGVQWEDKGNTAYSGNATAGTLYSNMVNQFSPFVIASTDGQSLPVELSTFTSAISGNNVTLSWETETEQNNSGFEVQRKFAGDTNWIKLNFVTGASNSSSNKKYKFEDRNLSAGIFEYRLKQIDFNGNYHYYKLQSIVTIGIPAKFELSQNYPNPFNPSTKINFSLPVDAQVSIKIYDMTGKEMATLVNNEFKRAGYFTIDFNASGLSSGTYFYRITAKDFIQTKKMTLVK